MATSRRLITSCLALCALWLAASVRPAQAQEGAATKSEAEGAGATPTEDKKAAPVDTVADPKQKAKDPLPTEADQEQGAQDPLPTEAYKEQKAAVADALAAESALPQFTARRGGSLGIPSAAGSDGFQAAVDAIGNDNAGNAFAKPDGVNFGLHARAEIIAEIFEESLPRHLLGGVPVTTELVVTKLSTTGLRLRYNTSRVLYVWKLQDQKCADALSHLTGDQFRQVAGMRAGKDAGPVTKARTACDVDALAGQRQHSFLGGLRIVRRISPEKEGAGSTGVAVEGGYQYESTRVDRSYTLYLSGSYLYMQQNDKDDKAGDSTARFPAVKEFRLSGGAELRMADVAGKNLAPRFGVYSNLAWNSWENRFNTGTEQRDVRGFQLEAGVYFGARLSGGFQGLLGISVLKSFGDDDHQLLVTFSPSASSSGTAPSLKEPSAPAGQGGGS